MRKHLKPANSFWTRPHSDPPTSLRKLQIEIFSNQRLNETQRLLNLLNSETRVQILFLLSRKAPLCVGDIADTLRLDISAVSHQLRILRVERLVKARRRKKAVFYQLDRVLPKLIESLLINTA